MFKGHLDFLIPIVAFTINLIIQVGSFRLLHNFPLLKSVLLGFISGLIVIVIGKDTLPIFLVNLITYASLEYCYFNFVTLGETGRRIRILREIYESEDGLTLDGLLSRYNAEEILRRRLDRLLKNGQIVLKGGRFFVGVPIFLWYVEIIFLLQGILFGKALAGETYFRER